MTDISKECNDCKICDGLAKCSMKNKDEYDSDSDFGDIHVNCIKEMIENDQLKDIEYICEFMSHKDEKGERYVDSVVFNMKDIKKKYPEYVNVCLLYSINSPGLFIEVFRYIALIKISGKKEIDYHVPNNNLDREFYDILHDIKIPEYLLSKCSTSA